MYSDYLFYKRRLKQNLERVYAEYMGQNRPLTDLVPGCSGLPPEPLAEQIAQVLVFHLPRFLEPTDTELCDSRRWLRAAILFLFTSCPEEDHIPYNLIRLADIDKETREQMNLSALPACYRTDFINAPPTMLKASLEPIFWSLAEPPKSSLDALERRLPQVQSP